MNDIKAQYILDTRNAYLQGGSASLAPDYSETRVSFVLCNREEQFSFLFEDVQCASYEEQREYLYATSPTIELFNSKNFIDFKEIENPLQKNFI